MNIKLKSHLIIILYLAIGFAVMGVMQLFSTPEWLNQAFIILGLFVVINLATVKTMGLKADLLDFWSLKKIWFLPIGIIAGGLIAISPVLAGLITGVTSFGQLKLDTDFTLSSILVTLTIVSWEELWFRGLFLNYCNRNLPAIHIAVTVGLWFMLVHLMNPEIDLIKTGPTLFFAGAFLTIVYFYFRNIWLPVGLHFGNNYLTIQSNIENHWLFGNEGYFGAVILGLLFIIFAKLFALRNRKYEFMP